MTTGAAAVGLTIEVRLQPGSVTLVLAGEVDGVAESELWAAMRTHREGRADLLILDCAAVTYMDSTGLRLVAKARPEGRLVVANLRPSIRRIFEIAGMADVVVS